LWGWGEGRRTGGSGHSWKTIDGEEKPAKVPGTREEQWCEFGPGRKIKKRKGNQRWSKMDDEHYHAVRVVSWEPGKTLAGQRKKSGHDHLRVEGIGGKTQTHH